MASEAQLANWPIEGGGGIVVQGSGIRGCDRYRVLARHRAA